MADERVFTMPDLGEGLEEGEIVAWLVAEGDRVELNQPLVEVETAKATVEIPSPWAGEVRTLHGGAGAAVPVGSPLVTLAVDGAPGAVVAAAPAGAAVGGARGGAGVAATPIVRRLAKDLGVELARVRGTGPQGRVTAEDVRAAAGQSEAPAVDIPGGGTVQTIELTPTRRAIATNLERQAEIPQVTTFRTLDCSALEPFRAEVGVSPLPVLAAALARVRDTHPLVNAAWQGDRIAVPSATHIGLAVDTERGLIVAVLRDAQARGISELAAEIRRLADAARGGSLTPEESTGATIAVSNTGSYGSEAGTPILSPGTAVTLAMGVIAPRALVVDGAIQARPACTLSCTFDHRVLDGAAAGRALTDLVALLGDADALRTLPR
jgi:2-oxoisovalerate dehydrogenase E2 component (dihydrolipoyl transacylase)